VVAVPVGYFDDLDHVDDSQFDGNDYTDFDIDSFLNAGNVGAADNSTSGSGAHYVQIPSFDQFGQPIIPQAQPTQQYGQAEFDHVSGVIDPTLLQSQPQAQHPWTFEDSTPGLTAVPGANDFAPMLPAQAFHFTQPVYADPYMAPGPVFFPSQAYQQTGYTPIEQPAPAANSNKRARYDSDSDSEGEAPSPKRPRSTQQAQDLSGDESNSPKSTQSTRVRKPARGRRASRDSGFSSESSLGRLNKPNLAHAGEKPQKSEDKPWVRINNNTKGETTRTARINNEAKQELKYKYKPLPHADGYWCSKSGKYTFEYTSHGGLDEFKKKKMSARQIMAYIMDFPTDDLRLWIQVSPADMARRYGSPGHSKCLFEHCPKHVWGDSGTIDVGHYRVAFDEKFKAFGNKTVDPFDCPGFVHLYCLERFCDFERICANADVQVDTRVDLPRELGQAKWTMSGRPEAEQASYFIKACKKDKLRQTEAFAQYPVHTSSSAPKQFDRTLVHALADINVASRTRSQMRQFVERKLTPNVLMINKGDMEIAMTQKKIKQSEVYKKSIKKKRATAASFDFEALYDEYDPVINQRIAEYRNLKVKYDREDAAGTAPRRTKAPAKRKASVVANYDSDSEHDAGPSHRHSAHDDDSDNESDFAQSPRAGTRSSPRKRQRVSYAVEDEQQPVIHQAYQAPAPQQPPQPYIAQGYVQARDIRKRSLSEYFPKSGPSLDDFPPPGDNEDPALTAQEIDDLLARHAQLERRKSSTLSNGPWGGIMKARSPRSPRSPRRAGRVASFARQPVSSSQEYNVNDPPSQLVATPTHSSAAAARRSTRLASRH